MPPRQGRQHCQSRARTSLACGALTFVAAQFAFFLGAPWWHPDAEFAAHLSVLRQRLKEEPNRPLVLVVGCSRCDFGFQPEKLAQMWSRDPAHPLIFNFSHLGAGPVLNLLQVRRVLQAGVHPRQVVLEVMPAFLANEWKSIYEYRAQAGELLLLHRCRGDWCFLASFCKRRVWPWYQNRRELLNRLNPLWTVPGEDERVPLGPLGNYLGLSASVPEDYRAKILHETHDLYRPSLSRFEVAASSRRALYETAELCRAEGIELTLLLTPEGSDFRSWYSAESVTAVEQFCAELNRDYGLRLIDARRWLPDEEFVDSHHMLTAGADRFTRRLGERLEAIHLARSGGGALR